MINITELWKKRFQIYIKEMSRYLKLIFNDHLKLALVFAIGAGAYYYQQWLEVIPSNFPALFIIVLSLSFILTQSPIRTFLKIPDLIFLLPIETKLKRYFTYSKGYAFVIQSYIVIIVFAALLPLYFSQYRSSFQEIILFLIVLLLCKLWNIWLRGYVQYFSEQLIHFSDWVVRFTINILFTYFLLSNANVLFLVMMMVIMVILIVYFKMITKNKGIQWEYLIDLESKRMQAFYRIANLFTDVPRLREQVRKRQWLNWITRFIPFSQTSTFSYIYMKTFMRTSDYFGIYVRILIIGCLLIYYLPFQFGKFITLILFLYFSGFQLITLYRHHSTKIWLDLYPVSLDVKVKSFIHIIHYLILFKSIIYTIMMFLSAGVLYGLVSLIIGIAYSFIFSHVYVKNKIRKLDMSVN